LKRELKLLWLGLTLLDDRVEAFDFSHKFFLLHFLPFFANDRFSALLVSSSAIFLVIFDDLDISLDVIDCFEAIFADFHFKSINFLFDQLSQLQNFNVFHFEISVLFEDGFFFFAVDVSFEFVVEIFYHVCVGVVVALDRGAIADNVQLSFHNP
jgi:hypothetical protein